MSPTSPKLEQGHAPNSCQYTAKTTRGDYLIQISWPLCWSEDRVPPDDDYPVSILYLVDGNVFFFTATDICRRLEFTDKARTIVVGIGYPPSKYIYDWRRGPDLTPPTPDGKYEWPLGSDGKPLAGLRFGEADELTKFIERDVMTYVHMTLFQGVNLSKGRSVLFGHSYGGVFALNALYTKTSLFDAYIASSPAIYWSDYALVKNQEAAFLKRNAETPTHDSPPALLITWGTGEEDLERFQDESEEMFKQRKEIAENKLMKSSALSLLTRLKGCPGVGDIQHRVFPGEDHGSVGVVGLQHGIMQFLKYVNHGLNT